MMATPRILIAATSLVMRAIEQSLGTGAAFLRAATLDDALKLIEKESPQLVIIGYHFEQARALILHLQEQLRGRKLPIILVRVLSLPLAERNEKDIRAAYQPLGVDEFISLYDDELRLGTSGAVDRLRNAVFSRLGFTA